MTGEARRAGDRFFVVLVLKLKGRGSMFKSSCVQKNMLGHVIRLSHWPSKWCINKNGANAMKVRGSFSDCVVCPGSFGLEYCLFLLAEMLIGLWVMRNMGCSWDYPCKGLLLSVWQKMSYSFYSGLAFLLLILLFSLGSKLSGNFI